MAESLIDLGANQSLGFYSIRSKRILILQRNEPEGCVHRALVKWIDFDFGQITPPSFGMDAQDWPTGSSALIDLRRLCPSMSEQASMRVQFPLGDCDDCGDYVAIVQHLSSLLASSAITVHRMGSYVSVSASPRLRGGGPTQSRMITEDSASTQRSSSEKTIEIEIIHEESAARRAENAKRMRTTDSDFSDWRLPPQQDLMSPFEVFCIFTHETVDPSLFSTRYQLAFKYIAEFASRSASASTLTESRSLCYIKDSLIVNYLLQAMAIRYRHDSSPELLQMILECLLVNDAGVIQKAVITDLFKAIILTAKQFLLEDTKKAKAALVHMAMLAVILSTYEFDSLPMSELEEFMSHCTPAWVISRPHLTYQSSLRERVAYFSTQAYRSVVSQAMLYIYNKAKDAASLRKAVAFGNTKTVSLSDMFSVSPNPPSAPKQPTPQESRHKPVYTIAPSPFGGPPQPSPSGGPLKPSPFGGPPQPSPFGAIYEEIPKKDEQPYRSVKLWFMLVQQVKKKICTEPNRVLDFLKSPHFRLHANDFTQFMVMRLLCEKFKTGVDGGFRRKMMTALDFFKDIAPGYSGEILLDTYASCVGEMVSYKPTFLQRVQYDDESALTRLTTNTEPFFANAWFYMGIAGLRILILNDPLVQMTERTFIEPLCHHQYIDNRGDKSKPEQRKTLDTLVNFMNSTNPVRTFLVTGPTGSGKTCVALKVAKKLCEQTTTKHPLVCYVHGPMIPNSSTDLVPSILRSPWYNKSAAETVGFPGFDDTQIAQLKKQRYPIFLLVDSVEGMPPQKKSLFESNRLSEWNIRIIYFGNLPEDIGADALCPFTSWDGSIRPQVERIHLLPFDKDQTISYVTKLGASLEINTTIENFYLQYQEAIPEIKELRRNPLMCRLILGLLADFMGRLESMGGSAADMKPTIRKFFFETLCICFIRSRYTRNSMCIPQWTERAPTNWLQGTIELCKCAAIVMNSSGKDVITLKSAIENNSDPAIMKFEKEFGVHYKTLISLGPFVQLKANWISFIPSFPRDIFLLEDESPFNQSYWFDLASSMADASESEDPTTEVTMNPYVLDRVIHDSEAFLSPGICQMIQDKFSQEPQIVVFLRKVVDESKTDSSRMIAASKAMTALKSMKYSFTGENLSGVRIPYANLSFTSLKGQDFSGADLSQVNLIGSQLEGVKFTSSRLGRVRTGLIESIKSYSGMPILLCTWSSSPTESTLIYIMLNKKKQSSVAQSVIFNRNNSILSQNWPIPHYVGCVCETKDYKDESLVVTGGADGFIRVWSSIRGNETAALQSPQKGSITTIVSYRDLNGTWSIASGGDDGRIRIWNVVLKKQINEAHVSRHPIRFLANLKSNSRRGWLAYVSNDKCVEVWDTKQSGVAQKTLAHASDISAMNTMVSPAGFDWILSAGLDRAVYIWDVETASVCLSIRFKLPVIRFINPLPRSEDAHMAVLTDGDGVSFIWDIVNRCYIGHVSSSGQKVTSASIVTNPQGDAALVTAFRTGVIHLTNLTEHITQFTRVPAMMDWAFGSNELFDTIKYKDIIYYAQLTGFGTMSIWDHTNQIPIATSPTMQAPIASIKLCVLSDDRLYLAIGDTKSSVRLMDIEKMAYTNEFRAHDGDVTIVSSHRVEMPQVSPLQPVAPAPTHTMLITHGSEGLLRFWDLDTMQTPKTHSLVGTPARKIISFEDPHLGLCLCYTTSDDKLTVWSFLHSRKVVVLSIPYSEFTEMAFVSSTRPAIIHTTPDNHIVVFDFRTGERFATLKGHTKRIRQVVGLPLGSFTPMVVSASDDGTVRLWDVREEKCLFKIEQRIGGVTNLGAFRLSPSEFEIIFTSDGGHVVSGVFKFFREESRRDSTKANISSDTSSPWGNTGIIPSVGVFWTQQRQTGPKGLELLDLQDLPRDKHLDVVRNNIITTAKVAHDEARNEGATRSIDMDK